MCSGGWFKLGPLNPAWDQHFSLFALFLFRLQGQTQCFGCFPSGALLTDFALIPWCHLNKLEARGGGESDLRTPVISAAVVLGGKLIWCCYVSVIILSNHIIGLGTARNNRREHSRYQRGATKIDCLFRYQIETLLLGDGKQPSPHLAFTRPCLLHTVCVSVHHPKVKGDIKSELQLCHWGKGRRGDGGVWALVGFVDAWNFSCVCAVLRGFSLCLMFFLYSSYSALFFPNRPQCLPFPFFFKQVKDSPT